MNDPRLVRTLVLLIVAGGLLTSSIAMRTGDWTICAFGGAGAIAVAASLVLFMRSRLKTAFREQESMRYILDCEIGNEGLKYSWSLGTSITPWSNIRRWKETAEFFLLYQSNVFANILPKHALSEEEMQLIRQKVAGLKRV